MSTPRRAPDLDRATVRRFWVVVLATLCVVVAAQAGPWQPTPRAADPATAPGLELPEQPAQRTPPADGGPALPEPTGTTADLGWLPRAVLVALVAVLLVLLVRWGLRQRLPVRPSPPEPAGGGPPVAAPRPEARPDAEVLQAGARAAEEHLRAATSPVDAVIAAWVALEDAAARSGLVRERSATATEFTLHVLDRTPADPGAARTLLALYLRARFDDQPLAADDVRSAAEAARTLVDTVHGPARAPRAAPPGDGGAP